ncbi:MAG: secretion protein [Rhodobacterales bacterium 32-64-14]|nr:MAG: secretion protein [Rhodobacterales bacterium 32-64-14]
MSEFRKDADAGEAGRTGPVPETASETPTEIPPARRSGRALRLGILLIAVAALAVLGSRWVAARWSQVSIDDARIAANLVTVSSEVSGEVLVVEVMAGERVEAGERLVSLDPAQAELVVAGTEARIAALDAQVEQLRAQMDMIRAQIDSRLAAARAQIAAAEATHAAKVAELRNVQSRFVRAAALADRKIVTPQELEDTQATLDTARQQELATAAATETARANLEVVRSDAGQIAVLERQIAKLTAEKTGLEAERGQRQIDLRNRTVSAAFAGVVDATFVDQGEYVTPGTRLLVYHRPDQVWVDANVKETDIRRIRIGAPATITVDAYPGREFRGRVERIAGAATSQLALLPSPNPSGNFTKVTQRVPIRVSIDAAGEDLAPGMMVVVRIDVGD